MSRLGRFARTKELRAKLDAAGAAFRAGTVVTNLAQHRPELRPVGLVGVLDEHIRWSA